MSNITWNIDGIKESLSPLKSCIGKLQDASGISSSIIVPADFLGGENLERISSEIDGVLEVVKTIKNSINGIINKFEFAEMRNKKVTDEMFNSLNEYLFSGTYFDKDIKYNFQYIQTFAES